MPVSQGQLKVQIERLIDCFGDKAFSEQRERMIWEAVEGLEYDSVIKIVDGFIRSSKYAPLPSDFAASAKDFTRTTKRYALGEIQPPEIAQCWDCGDSGFIRLIRKKDHQAWAKANTGTAPCHCDRGRQLIEAGPRMRYPTHFGPQFNELWLSSYEINHAYEGEI